MEEPIPCKDRDVLRIKDVLSCQVDLVEDYERNEEYKAVRTAVDCLGERKQKIIKMYFGFDNCEECTQKVISKELNISRSYVEAIMQKTLKKLREELLGNQSTVIEDATHPNTIQGDGQTLEQYEKNDKKMTRKRVNKA